MYDTGDCDQPLTVGRRSSLQSALASVNLGDDADTTGAIFGQIAGACYGAESIPRAWRERVTRVHEIIG